MYASLKMPHNTDKLLFCIVTLYCTITVAIFVQIICILSLLLQQSLQQISVSSKVTMNLICINAISLYIDNSCFSLLQEVKC